MNFLLSNAVAFNGDISKWDVSKVTDMSYMFSFAHLFNGDLSKWDVSRVLDMNHMFFKAKSFKQNLCGPAWVNSKASKDDMFAGSSGSISVGCTTAAFSPRSRAELQSAVDACIKLPPKGECSNGPSGPIGDWDVSSVTDMSIVFSKLKKKEFV